jgi:thymidylate synthase (FAD)
MKLIKPSYQIITPINGEEILKQIELASITCYKSEGKIEYEQESRAMSSMHDPITYISKSARVLIPKLISRGHFAMLEFGGMITVKFICDRGVSHELVRHRLCSFAQESTRYCNYGKDEHISFIIPSWLNDNYIGTYTTKCINFKWFNTMLECEAAYNVLIESGWSPQRARSILPNSLKTEINLSCNIREWREIFRQRTSAAAHPQIVELMRPLLDEFKSRIPILFDDINY